MKCKKCNSETYVIDTRSHNSGGIRRRRVCLKCGERFTTIENLREYEAKDFGYTKEILEKATIRGLAEYLLYGKLYGEDPKNHEERMAKVYAHFDELVEECCTEEGNISKLQDYASELVRETSEVYMEIGMQAGMMLAMQVGYR